MNIPQPVAGGSIAEIEDGLYIGRFNDIVEREVDAFKTEKDKFGKPDSGIRFDFNTTLLDANREPVLLMDVKEGVDDPDAEFELRQAKSVKVFSSDERANSFTYLKGILTATELALWEASGKGNAEADAAWAAAGAKVNGRLVNIQVSHNDKGYPQIEAFLGPVKAAKKPAAAAEAE